MGSHLLKKVIHRQRPCKGFAKSNFAPWRDEDKVKKIKKVRFQDKWNTFYILVFPFNLISVLFWTKTHDQKDKDEHRRVYQPSPFGHYQRMLSSWSNRRTVSTGT